MLQNIKNFSHSGISFASFARLRMTTVMVLLIGHCAICSAQTRILDLSEVGPADFKPLPANDSKVQASGNQPGQLFLPPIPFAELDQSETQAEVTDVAQISNSELLANPFLISPTVDEIPAEEELIFLPPIISSGWQEVKSSQVADSQSEQPQVMVPPAVDEELFEWASEIVPPAPETETLAFLPPAIEEASDDDASDQVVDYQADAQNEDLAVTVPLTVDQEQEPFAWARELVPAAIENEQLVFLPPVIHEPVADPASSYVPPAIDEAFQAEEEPFLIPPPADHEGIQYTSAEAIAESIGNIDVELAHDVAEVESETLTAVSGEYEVLGTETDSIETVSYAEIPILATHKAMGVAHRCTSALQSPVPGSWIFWRNAKCERTPGPVCCKLQSRFVNWRLSSTYLQGCMPEGYSLRHFIESSQNVEYHGSPLVENGPVDPGGSFEDAKKIEGDETRPIQQVSINITPPEGALPEDRAEEKFEQLPQQDQMPGTHRLWSGTSFYWNASLLNHQPLYFEDVNLERHGFSRGCVAQPLVSGVKFFGRLPALPYLMAANPAHETSFTLGQTRPGSHACYVCERPRLQLDAAAVEAAAIVGLFFLIP